MSQSQNGPFKFHNHEVCHNHKGSRCITIIMTHRKYHNHKEKPDVSYLDVSDEDVSHPDFSDLDFSDPDVSHLDISDLDISHADFRAF